MIKGPIVFHLVHGTFAQNAEWTREGSAIRDFLKKTRPDQVKIEVFPWTGSNTHKERLTYSKGLEEHLEKSFKNHPDHQHIVIAHSHGGNLALYATRNPKIGDRISGLICLATPFMNSKFSPHLIHYSRLFLMAPFIFLFGGLAVFLVGETVKTADFLISYGWSEHSLILFFIGAIICIFLTYQLIVVSYRESREKINGKRKEYESMANKLNVPTSHEIPILCIRAVNDEARNVLFAYSFFTKLLRWLVTFSGLILVMLGIALSLYLGSPVALLASLLLIYPIYWVSLMVTWLLRGWHIPGRSPKGPANPDAKGKKMELPGPAFSPGYGGETITEYQWINTWVSTWLPHAENITRSWHFYLPFGVVHSMVYKDPKVFKVILDWLDHNTRK